MADQQVENTSPPPENLHMDDHGHNSYTNFFIGFKGFKRWISATIFFFFFLLFIGAFFFRIDTSIIRKNFLASTKIYQLECPEKGQPITCSNSKYPDAIETNESSSAACPDYFRWIHEDLRPWKTSGVSRETLENAKKFATFRLVIINGTVYLERYHRSFQTRDLFTLWGILQLLRLYPGRIPDLELMFQCGDMPEVLKKDYQDSNVTLIPPSLFQYSSSNSSFGIIFPDWSFWGWAEVNIKPWESMIDEIIKKNKRKKWKNRERYAYWKGNPYVSGNRADLMTCNPTDKHDWNARLYTQDWIKESKQGYKHSNLADQCIHRYKIYIEGRAWSVSDKYILGCDSMTLLVNPEYYDFFLRSIVPLQHYWPIRKKSKCQDIKFAVDWGNANPDKAEAIGKEGSRFIKENLKMEYIYGYMYHLLKEYAKLLKFKPEIPKGGIEICSASMACPEVGTVRKFLEESMVMSPSNTVPCAMPPPYDPHDIQLLFERNKNITQQIVSWEHQKSDKKHG